MSIEKPTLLEILDAVRVLENAGLFQWGPVPGPPRTPPTPTGSGKSGRKPPKRRKKKRWSHVTDKQVRQFMSLRKNGLNRKDAAHAVGHHASTMGKHVDKFKESKST